MNELNRDEDGIDGPAFNSRLTMHETEVIRKELLAIQERLKHLRVAVFEENQSICIDRFDFLGLVGKGGYSRIHKVTEKNSKAVYAIKVVRKVLALHRQCIRHLKAEVAILTSFKHE